MLEKPADEHEITGGIDTHADTHTVAALDVMSRQVGRDCVTTRSEVVDG